MTKRNSKVFTKEYDASECSCGSVLSEIFVVDKNYAKVFVPNPTPAKKKTVEHWLQDTCSIVNEDGSFVTLQEVMFDDVNTMASAYFSNELVPLLQSKHNIHSQFSSSVNRIYIKTEDGIALELSVKYHIDKELNGAIIDTYSVKLVNFRQKNDRFVKAAEELGFVEQVEN